MSSNLRWRPVSQKSYPELSTELKHALQRVYNGYVNGVHFNAESPEHIAFLRGLIAAEVPGAKELLAIVEKHGEVELWEEY